MATKSTGPNKKATTPNAKGAKPAVKSKKADKKPRSKAKKWTIRIALGLLIAFLVTALAGVIAGIYLYATVQLPDPNADFTTNTTHIYYNDGKTEMSSLAIQNRETIPYEEMPANIKDAVVAIENMSFWEDSGVSLWGMARSAVSVAFGGQLASGSTITQQYIKILYLNSEQTASRKVKEIILAYKMGQEMSKEDILAGYLNTIYFGRGAYGIQAASQAYFGVDAKDLDLAQAATLAAVLNDPGGFNPPDGNVDLLLQRYQVTLNNMVEMGTITEAQKNEVYYELPEFAKQKQNARYDGPKGFLVKMVEDELKAAGFTEAEINGGGLQVTATIDAEDQKAAVKAVESNVKAANSNAPDDAEGVHSGLASVEVGTGEILALYGGPDYVTSSQNLATTPRPTGSVFKINALIAALRDGMSLNTTLNGNSFTVDGTTITNGRNYGQVTLLKATASSINTAYVDLVTRMDDGPAKVVQAANDLGIPTGEGWGLYNNIAMGAPEVSPLAEAGALATLANKGVYIAPHIVKEVKDLNGNVVYTASTEGEQRVDADIAADATYALSKVVTEGTATKVSGMGFEIAGKTGTRDTDDNGTTAAWFAGTTMQVATAVDYVAGDKFSSDLDEYTQWGGTFFGSSYPASTWMDYMEVAMSGKDSKSFPDPVYVNKGKKSASEQPTVKQTKSASPSTKPTPSTTPSQTPEPSQEPVETQSTPVPDDPTTDTSTQASTEPSKTSGGGGGGSAQPSNKASAKPTK